MKAWKRNKEFTYDYPDEMEKILSYLEEQGTLFVNGNTIENLYRGFSEDEYCASWMSVDEEILEEFANWLEKIDI